ncbi:MAG: carboxylating nicotinate-nucleotide diphosphorylase [Chloroflexi bacterium]|nr:carboxylating nicotinate-nucleotide diphosphorylase [Chloroflexota bacterium]
MPNLDPVELDRVVDAALAEDLFGGDVTTDALIPRHMEASARFVPRAIGVIAGLDVARAVFARVDASLRFTPHLVDGDVVEGGETVAIVSGNLASILRAERVALNFMQRMSGIASLTAKFVEAVSGTGAIIVDTRKTAPGLRSLDKAAVVAGGGRNHRRSLSDGVLIKDNHVAALQAEGMSLQQIIRRARAQAPHTVKIEVEVESLDEVPAAIEGGADIIMLDNMTLEAMRSAVEMCRGKCLTEASGMVSLETVREIAGTGVDMISIGALTHSVKALDIGLDFD